jgi:hypothetical protein
VEVLATLQENALLVQRGARVVIKVQEVALEAEEVSHPEEEVDSTKTDHLDLVSVSAQILYFSW